MEDTQAIMPVMLMDAFEGVEFDEEITVQGFEFAEIIPLDHLRPLRRNDRVKIIMSSEMTAWIEENCAGEAILCTERDDFLIAFSNPADALLYNMRYSAERNDGN